MLSGMQKASALAWAAQMENVSYGSFAASMTIKKEEEIYRAYEQRLKEKKRAERAWLARREKASTEKEDGSDQSASVFDASLPETEEEALHPSTWRAIKIIPRRTDVK